MSILTLPTCLKDGEETHIKGNIILPNYYSGKLKIFLVQTYEQKKYKFTLEFDKPTLYRKMRRFVFTNHKKDIIVFGKWYSSGFNSFTAKITNETQIIAE